MLNIRDTVIAETRRCLYLAATGLAILEEQQKRMQEEEDEKEEEITPPRRRTTRKVWNTWPEDMVSDSMKTY